MSSFFFFFNFFLDYRFGGKWAEHARQLRRYTHGSVLCFSSPLHPHLAFLPMLSLPNSPPTAVPPLFPPTDPSVWCSPPCVHLLSLFNTRLWVRTCGISFSVLVSVCWEWCSPGSSMSLQRTQTHRFWLLYNIPWFICAIFSLSIYHRWAFGLIPGLCYCKQCCNEHSCTCVLIVERFIVFWIYTQ